MSPGGYIEMQDTDFPIHCDDGTMLEDSALSRWGNMIADAARSIGYDLVARKYKQLMLDAGFVDVQEFRFVWPQNTWPADNFLKELGRWNLANNLEGLEAYSMALMTRVLGMTLDEAQLMLVDVRKDMKDRTMHAYWPM